VGGPDPDERPAVRVPGPQHRGHVKAEEGAQQCQDHVVFFDGAEERSGLRQVQGVGHHEEGVPEQREVVAQALGP